MAPPCVNPKERRISVKTAIQQALELGKTKTALGHVATYIPELGKADPTRLGICAVLIIGPALT